MCFSANADLAAGVVIAAIGVDTVRHVRTAREIPVGLLPLVLAIHQLTETVVWWGVDGGISTLATHVATWFYLLIAFVVLPIYLPLAIFAVETDPVRRRLIGGLCAIGALVSLDLLISMIRGNVTARVGDCHVAYGVGISHGGLVVLAYVAATCGATLLSSSRFLRWFGVLNLIVVAALAVVEREGFASLWCFWAALTSVAFDLFLRQRRATEQRVVPQVREPAPTP